MGSRVYLTKFKKVGIMILGLFNRDGWRVAIPPAMKQPSIKRGCEALDPFLEFRAVRHPLRAFIC